MKRASLSKAWPKYLRRGPMEIVACVIIAVGIAMMLQPLALVLFTWSFLTTLFGTLMFTVVSKFPQ
jgi:mannose/fructose/N-acetylgalactosamine-specific phosphotransferase system component IIC